MQLEYCFDRAKMFIMSFVIVGLGNSGEEYSNTRHNTGRIVLEYFAKKNKDDFSEWETDKKLRAIKSTGKLHGESVVLLEPETMMNRSGESLKPLITSPKKAEKLIVIYDELDLPLGSMKISFNRGTGGHRGLESIAKAIKTKAFIRIRIGISPSTPSGKIRKPKGEDKVVDFILGKFKAAESDELKKVSKKVSEALAEIIESGLSISMNRFNQ